MNQQAISTSIDACFHCGEETQVPSRWQVAYQGEQKHVCCAGCKAVSETIIQAGLGDYYDFRTELPDLPPPVFEDQSLQARETLHLYDSDAMQGQFVTMENGLHTATLVVEGISCAACVWLIEHKLRQLNGVVKCSVNLSSHRLYLEWQQDEIALSLIMEHLLQLGYRVTPFSATQDEAIREQENKLAIRRLAVAGIGAMQVMMLAVPLYVGMATQYEFFMRLASMLMALPVVLFSARPFFDAALRSLRTRHLTMDVPVSIAILLAYSASIWSTLNQGVEVYFDSVCMFTFFLLIGRFLEMRARHRMGQAGNNLLTLLPTVGMRIPSQAIDQANIDATSVEPEVIAVEDIQIGDYLLIRPGATIPADGRIYQGITSVDEAALTGEYLPLAKASGDIVTGGTINIESPIIIQVTATGAEAKLSTIVRLMDRAQQDRPAIATLADRLASYFVAAVLITSVTVYSVWTWLGNHEAFFIALSVLVVTCPCALSLATPTALTAATTFLRERGLLISKGHVIETLNSVNRVVFDKTGTLTQGRLGLAGLQVIQPIVDRDNGQVLGEQALCQLVAALEKNSVHPIAAAFHSMQPMTAVTDIEHYPSQGVEGVWQGHILRFGRPDFAVAEAPAYPTSGDQGQWLLLSVDDVANTWFQLTDTLRPHAKLLIDRLKQRGLDVDLLSGDPGYAVQHVANELGVDNYQKNLTAEDKLEQIRQWQAQGDIILMVGDGINDVPVLAGSDVSVAVNEASDLAKTSADILLTNGRIDVMDELVGSAKRTRRIIKQNITWALLYNLAALPLAAAGYVPPWAAAIGMSLSSVLVVVNALRLTRAPKRSLAR